MAVALASALIAYKGAHKLQYRASCFFQAVIHQSAGQPQTDEQLAFANKFSVHEVNLAVAAGAYAQVAKTLKIRNLDLGKIATGIVPGQLGTFAVTVVNKDQKRSSIVANTACTQLIASIKQQRTNELNDKVGEIQARISSIQKEIAKIEKIPAKKRTVTQRADLQADKAALLNNAQLIANTMSLPPDELKVVVPSGPGKLFDQRSLTKNVLVAGVGGLLACFIVVLVGEILADRRRRTDALIARGGG